MYLALRPGASSRARWIDKLATWAIKARLVTKYPHAGIVINDRLYHSNGKKGLHSTTFDPSKWVLIDNGTARDQKTLALFEIKRGAKYDWFSLLAFVGLRSRDSNRYYCYEWCFHAMTGRHPTERVTVETLLMLIER